ncbi:MAG: methionine--tRNA ligase [Spirochaetes bacterium]|nr:MAG: methionine--tRNA ligase [Spirochaetota bacterium]
MKKRLITSALPYVNNIPHLGNLIQVLSADVFARFSRLKGYETLYICGTDEYGTATETKALEEGITPKELCDRYYKIHTDIYKWFNISFDRWGRTSTPKHTEITQHIFLKLDENGYINEKTIEQLYCKKCDRFLADRYVHGTCPSCGYDSARGDQCESCGKLLDPTELIEPKCGICGETPRLKETKHLYLNLPAILPKLKAWMKEASVKGFWARNAIQMTESWIRDGLKERCITRDLKWGIPVPKDGYRDKVFYVWFDACIGYISITANHTDRWEEWWKNPEEVELFQFIGKDNIPFHTVIFPSSLLGTGENWTTLHHMSSTEYLNYESGKFSKSKGVGVFGNDAKETGIPADAWRFYIFYNRPEKSDVTFIWNDFREKVNGELIGNLSNFVNRTLSFIHKFFNGVVPEGKKNEELWRDVERYENRITEHLERAEIRDALRDVFALSSLGNKTFQDGEPWKTVQTNPKKARKLIYNLVYLVRDLAILAEPFIPETSGRIAGFLNIHDFTWEDLRTFGNLHKIETPALLFELLEEDLINELRERFSGSQKEREESRIEWEFVKTVDLVAAKITEVKKHPKADKLYIEMIDTGCEKRQIVSGLVPYYSEEELAGRNIILVRNLKPARLRGEESRGMLLAAEQGDKVEVLFADHAKPGDKVCPEGYEDKSVTPPGEIDIEKFFQIPMMVKDNVVFVGERALVCAGERITTEKIANGKVG